MQKGIKVLVATTISLTPMIAYADWKMPAEGQVKGVPSDLTVLILNVINWILGFIALIAVLMLIWGGVQYVTAAGSQDQVRNAKETLKNAIIGLVVAGLAYALVNLIVVTILAPTA